MRIIAVIPARMGSSRFPGKPLAMIDGIPMLGHVYFRSRLNRRLDTVYIATCDEEIRRYALSIGAECVMTSPLHERASDRTAEAAAIIDKRSGRSGDVVVMIQGDEPMIHPDMIDEAIAPILADTSVRVVNLMAPLDHDSAQDPNEIKVVCDRSGHALYFSRLPVPWRRDPTGVPLFKQVCVIPFRRGFLDTFAALEQTPLERAESIDMLRALEHGYRVRMVRTRYATRSVDTPDDLVAVSVLMSADALPSCYGDA
jgi:3-deoxy-manno-octulosonate cytidylyltransferase (CMP-KDO synthetase)